MEGESRWDGPLRAASDKAWRILAVLALAAVVAVIGVSLAAIVVPALPAVVVVPVGRPLFEILGRRLPRSVAAGLVLVLAAAALGAASWLMMASIVANWDALWSGIADAIAAVTKWIDEQVQALTDEQIATMQENLRDLAGSISSVLVGGATRGVAVIGSFFVGLFLFLVTFFFGVRDWERCGRGWWVRA